jgi:5-methyltetrahydropteroyltriglutamate--homocysteine methyltransferase
MRQSTDRILTTHAGSLPRPDDLLETLYARSEGASLDAAASKRIQDAVVKVVRDQADAGIDVVDDGEVGKAGFIGYINARLGGFEPDPDRKRGNPWLGSREQLSFPDYYDQGTNTSTGAIPRFRFRSMSLKCTGPIVYKGHQQLQEDIVYLKSAMKGLDVAEAFVPSTSPANIQSWNANRYYRTDEEYVFAIADAMHEEYKAIVDAGLVVQIDDPQLLTEYLRKPHLSMDEWRKWASQQIEALNHALRGIPSEKIRFHTCYGIDVGPRIHDLELKDIVDLLLKLNVGAYSLEGANARHEHEWKVWKDVKLPDDRILIPGVITQSSVLVEHPELVADRIVRYAEAVGRERVIAGTDCGFGTIAGLPTIHVSIVWNKMKSLVDGARLASRRLWGRSS